jgi:hypothetical protein
VRDLPDPKQELAAPELSVILVVGGQRVRAGAALRSLLEQSIIDRIEILLFDLGPENCSALSGSDHPRVRATRGGPDDLLAAARVQGVHAANAPVICFMEEHCEVQPGWAEAIVLAHRGPWAGVGCNFVNGNPNAGNSDKAFRMNYGIYVRPQYGRGPVNRIAGQNSAFKRNVLLQYATQLEAMMTADLVLQWKMAQDGNQFFYEPAARMAHRNENTLGSLCRGVFYWNWCFSNTRAQAFQWGFPRRAMRLVLAPLIPWVRLARMFVRTLRLGRSEFAQLLRDIPYVLVVDHCSAAGQVAGLLNPVDPGVRAFSHFEMNEPRLLRAEFTQ